MYHLKTNVNQLRLTQPPPPTTAKALTRPLFYGLAEQCREYAAELAQYDPQRVNLAQCHKFNRWFAEVKGYAILAPTLREIKGARPIARWQILTIAGVLGVILWAALAPRLGRGGTTALLSSYPFLFMLGYFMPERLYGTTVEMIEGKVLRVVEALEALLQADQLQLTEAAYFRAKANLAAARAELREQIDLAHRRWR